MRTGTRGYVEAEGLLKRTFEEVKHQHATEAGRDFIRRHWSRYVHIIQALPEIPHGARILEIGASIMSNVLKSRFGAEMHAAYHELETEWPDRFRPAGIHAVPVELMRDPLPFDPGTFDLILFDEVVEHFPLSPEFFFKQIFRLLKPEGQLVFSVPNFATGEHRWQMLRGLNPQDHMDARFIYYAHHREPVMTDCLGWIRASGGKVLESRWSDYFPPAGIFATLWTALRYLRHLEFHRIAPMFFPSMRRYIFIRAVRDAGYKCSPHELVPPLSLSREFQAPTARGAGAIPPPPENRRVA